MPLNLKRHTRFEIVLPKKAKTVLERYAKTHQKTKGEVIRLALQKFFEAEQIPVDFAEGMKDWTPKTD